MKVPILLVLTALNFIHCKVSERHMSCELIRKFVDGHNARRFLLADGQVPGHPAAGNMKSLVWDEELYQKASKWARRNAKHFTHRHNPNNKIPSGRFTTSENLFWYSTSNLHHKLNPEDALDSWFDEHKNFTYGPLRHDHFRSGKPDIGHYTQMVWSDSIFVGCAIAKNIKNRWAHFFVVCNYGPQGNYLGQTPYKVKGTSSSAASLFCAHNECSRPYGKKC